MKKKKEIAINAAGFLVLHLVDYFSKENKRA